MKTFILILTSILLISCHFKNDCTTNIKLPIVVIGKSEATSTTFCSITVKDRNDSLITLTSRCALGSNLYDSYNKGDTIK